MDEKIELVQAHRHRYGLNACLRAVGLSKGTWHYRRHRKSQAERDAALKAEIVSVIEDHPGYGERRIHAELVERTGSPINHKRLRRVLKRYDLGLLRCLPKPSSSPVVEVVAQAGGGPGQGAFVQAVARLLDRFYRVVLRRRTAQGVLDGAVVYREPVGRRLGRRSQAMS